jgi:molecular chaperone IbpA
MNDFNIGKIAFGPAMKDFDKFFVGFDDQFTRLHDMHTELTKNIPGYPPYNIKKTSDTTYVIELAIAGFAKQDIEVELADNKLVIKGGAKNDEAEDSFLFKGIANRNFTRTFALEDQIEVKDAEMLNGMLKVFLERIIPEHKKPKKVDIKEPSAKSKKDSREILMEDPLDRNL